MKRSIALAAVVAGALSGAPPSARAGDGSLTTIGVAFGAPGSLGAFVDQSMGRDGAAVFSLRGQAGLGGGELSADLGPYRRDGESLVVRAAMVRTWGSPLGAEPGRTLAGARLEYGLALSVISAHAGVLVPLADGRARTTRFTWGFSIGIPLDLFSGPLIGRAEV